MKRIYRFITASLLALLSLEGCTPQAHYHADVSCANNKGIVHNNNNDIEPKQSDTKPTQPATTGQGKLLAKGHVSTSKPAAIGTDGVALFIDSGAVNGNVDISILATTEANSGTIPEHMQNLTPNGAVYRMLPDGQKFEKDITIAMHYDSTALPYGYTADDIYTFFYNEQTALWQKVERDSVDTERQIVYSRTNHFTDYINGVLKVPENSDVASYTPTSISDLKAADPMEGITLIAPPEANNQGTANLSYPLSIPAGRHGMQPNLSVNYSSAGGSGILGMGWSLPISEISVETRWGVPLYDSKNETEGYLLDGTTLVTSYEEDGRMRLNKPVYHRKYEPRDMNGKTQFFPRVEGSFRRIIRHGTTTKDYYWEVTDKDGMRHIYGRSNNSRLVDRKGNIAKWMLEKSIDTYGNTVCYTYESKFKQNNGERAGRQLVIDKITYTGNEHTGERGQYRIKFSYSDKQDISASFRYGMEEINNYLLDRVEVLYRDSIVREYYFGYREGTFGKTLLCNIVEGYDDPARDQLYDITTSPRERTTIRNASVYNRCNLVLPSNEKQSYLHIYHSFDYYDLPGDKLFAQPVKFDAEWSSGPNLANVFSHLLYEHDKFGGTASAGFTVGGGLNVGVGFTTWLKNITVGGHYAFNNDHNTSFMTLADINGDGYPDKLYRNMIGTLECRLQKPGENRFEAPRPVSGVKKFNASSTSSHNWGVEASVCGGLGAGGNWSDSRSTTSIYLADINGDGLPDIVDNGSVYLNKGNLVFEDITDSETIMVGGTCENDTWDFSGEIDPTIFDDGYYIVEREVCESYVVTTRLYDTIWDEYGKYELRDAGTRDSLVEDCITVFDTIFYSFPQRYEPNIDLVRMWKAPYTGVIKISGSAKLTDDLAEYRSSTRTYDGVWISIHQANDTSHLVASAILHPDEVVEMIGYDTVNAGDTIYFRINSEEKRLYDVVEWNPHIKYLSVNHIDNTIVPDYNRLDANRDSVYVFDYGRDYMLDTRVGVALGDDSDAVVTDTFQVTLNIRSGNPLSQDLKYSLVLKDYDHTGAEHYTTVAVLPVGSYVDNVYTSIIKARSDQGLFLRLEAKDGGQMRWSDIETEAEVVLIGSSSPMLRSWIADTDAVDAITFHPVVDRVYGDYLYLPGEPFMGVSALNNLNVSASIIPVPLQPNSIPMVMTIKDEGNTESYVRNVTLQSGINNIGLSGITLSPNKKYYVDFHTTSLLNATRIFGVKFKVSNISYHAGVYTKYSTDISKHHGTLYRGWGQFGYKSSDSTSRFVVPQYVQEPVYWHDTNEVLQPDENYINNFDTNAIANADNPEVDMGGYMNPLAQSFFEMTANGKTTCWESFGSAVIAKRNICSLDNSEVAQAEASGYDGEEITADMYQSPVPVVVPGQKMKAVNKQIMTKGSGYTVLMRSRTKGTSRLLGDFMDLNGDRYPDVVSEKNINYSKAQGGLGNLEVGYAYAADDGINKNENKSTGIAFNGTFLNALRELKSNPKSTNVVATVNGSHSPSPTGNALSSTDHVINSFTDVNGDGLADIVYDNRKVRYNMGYFFSLPRDISPLFIRESSSEGASVGASFNIGNTSISGGVGINFTDNKSDYSLIDISGDGLPDVVTPNGVGINRGFGNNVNYNSYGIEHSHTKSFNANGGGTYDGVIMIVWFPLKVGGSVNGGGSGTLSWTDGEYTDMNNDGLLDYIFLGPTGGLWVAYNNAGKVNLLKNVRNFADGEIELNYELSESTEQSPQRSWNMSSCMVYDGFDSDGENYMCRSFEYKNRKYDRFERDDYGYETVSTHDYLTVSDFASNQMYRTKTSSYLNSDYYNSHRMIREVVTDGNSFVENTWVYADADLRDGHWLNADMLWCEGDGWPALKQEKTRRKEATGSVIATAINMDYTSFGNVSSVFDAGDVNDPDDNYSVKLDYELDPVNHIVCNVKGLTIPGYRTRSATYTAEGSLHSITIDNNPSPSSDYSYKYDVYGNVIRVTTPARDMNGGTNYWIKYDYDPQTHTLPVMVRNIEGYTSSSVYSLRWQKPLVTTDMGGMEMHYSYDSHGRIDTIVAPMELYAGKPYTVRYKYWYDNRIERYPNTYIDSNTGKPHYFWARTYNYDDFNPSNDIRTVTFSDGLGRIVQVKKDVEIEGNEMRTVSGTVHYDGLGRSVKSYMPVSEPIARLDTNLNVTVDNAHYTTTEYDYLDRPTANHYPDGTSDTKVYSTTADASGINRFLTIATDQNGNITHLLNDVRNLNVETVDALNNTTRMRYDAVGQIVETIDPENNSTTYTYDLGGRRTSRNHPSAGVTHWEYDHAGNMVRMIQNSGESVSYTYDYNRLIEVSYSDRYWNNVYYQYGAPGSGEGAGRLLRLQDATGVKEMKYDCMGNVASVLQTYVQPNSPQTFTFLTQWTYDSWGRVSSITYPDMEVVRYRYDRGGNVCTIEGYKPGQPTTTYLDKVRYDRFEQRISQINGNGVETRYVYNPLNRRLDRMENYSINQNILLQSNRYFYDNVGNVMRINDGGLNQRDQYYEYDNIYRLTYSTGDWNNNTINYTTDYTYSPAGRLLTKNVTSTRLSSSVAGTLYNVDYSNNYTYPTSGNVFGVKNVYDGVSGTQTDMNWDANGNLISTSHDNRDIRLMCWTEDNRLQAYWELGDENGGSAAYYNYNAEGERNLKLTTPRLDIHQNAAELMQHPPLVYPTLYASSLITLNKSGYTKHYYEGSNRICSKIGGGFGNVDWNVVDSRIQPVEQASYDELHDRQHEGLWQTFSQCLHHDPEIMDHYDLRMVLDDYEKGRNDSEPAFYYHSDHLGSAAYLTNDAGQVTQTLNYLPYGEDWVDIQNFAETQYPRLGIYTFNGKEKDYESGYHYYGARYYWSELLTGWLSVDPMMDKYPGISPYNYCMWNPVKLVDPNGCMVDWVESAEGIIYWDDNATSPETTKAGEKYLGKNVLVATHGRDENLNEDVNDATFELYLESDHSGPVATIQGNTVPCDIESYGTLPEGLYAADETTYKGHPALRITSLETGSGDLKTVKGNPNNPNNYYDPKTKKNMKPISEHIMSGILFHRGNTGRKALKTSKGKPISEGCQTGLHGYGSEKDYNDFAAHFSGFHGTYYLRGKPTGSITTKCILK